MKNIDLPPKNEDEFLDYGLDWSKALKGDAIVTYTANVVSNTDTIALSNTWNSNTWTYFWLADGSVGQTSQIHHVIETANGRIFSITTNITISD